jgi:hypothetical protein
MKSGKYIGLLLLTLVFVYAFSTHSFAVAGDAPKDPAFEQKKVKALSNIELFEQRLHSTKNCISEARTSDELAHCHTDETTRKYQEVQQSLSEMGMSPEERRMNRLGRD